MRSPTCRCLVQAATNTAVKPVKKREPVKSRLRTNGSWTCPLTVKEEPLVSLIHGRTRNEIAWISVAVSLLACSSIVACRPQSLTIQLAVRRPRNRI